MKTGTGRAPRRAGLDPAEVYEALGPLTDTEIRWLTTQTRGERNRWLANIYGPVGAPYARTIYQHTTHTGHRPT